MSGDRAELHQTEFRLSWGECDPAGIIYYATYLEWAERVHTEWWYLAGRPLHPGVPSFVIRHVSCEYLAAPRPMDVLRCAMSLDRIGTTSFTMAFEFSKLDAGAADTAVAELALTAVFVGPEGTAVAVPDDARRLLCD